MLLPIIIAQGNAELRPVKAVDLKKKSDILGYIGYILLSKFDFCACNLNFFGLQL